MSDEETPEVDDDSTVGDSEAGVEADSEAEADSEVEVEAEKFIRYQNSMYRLISIGGGAVVGVLGLTVAAIGWTVKPKPPPGFFVIDFSLTLLLLLWYLLGLRCRLDVAQSWVHVATKYGDTRFERSQIVSIEPDLSIRGSLQWSGRPLIITYEKDEKSKRRKAFGCLPAGARDQDVIVTQLQDALGRPEHAHLADAEAAVAARLADMQPEVDPSIEEAVAKRLATMVPEGDDGSRRSAEPQTD